MTNHQARDISIVGCGPGGLACAIALHDSGFNVTLYEQFSQPKPVGSGLMLQPTGLDVLNRLGLRARTEQLGQRIDGMLGRLAPNGKTVLDIKYAALDPRLYGVAIHRASLFHVLYTAVTDRRIPVITNSRIVALQHLADQRVSLLDSDHRIVGEPADLVIDASGVQSRLLRSVSSKTKQNHSHVLGDALEFGALWTTVTLSDRFNPGLLEQRYKKANVMIGVLPCGKLPDSDDPLATLFWSIKAADFDRWKSDGLDLWKQEVSGYWPEITPLLEQLDHPDQLTHATYSHHTLRKPWSSSVIFIGDAAHATSPQLGQGANMALLDALAVCHALTNSPDIRDAGRLYAKLRRQHVTWYQTISKLLTPFYQSDSSLLPILRDTLFEPVSAIGPVNRLMTRLGAGLLTQPLVTIDKQQHTVRSR